MRTIYKPQGKAREYAALALNLYSGCSHGCLYCYVPRLQRRTREEFMQSECRWGVTTALAREAIKHAGKSVLLCFSCDPYQPDDVMYGLARHAIQILHSHRVKVNVLTKAGMSSISDFDLLGRGDKYGASLTFNSDEDSIKWEPNAALPMSRINALQAAHNIGISTWASLEPVIEPAQSLTLILKAAPFVDEFKVGRWNHDPRAEEIDWRDFAQKAVALLKRLGKRYYVKKDLRRYLENEI